MSYSCRAFVPADGAANGVTTDRLYSTADRRRPPVLMSLYLVAASTREGGTTGRGCSARHRPPCGRPCWTEEGRQAAGQLPAGSTLALCRSGSGGNMISYSGPATGRWRIKWRSCAAGLPAEEAAESSFAEGGKTMTGLPGVCFYRVGAKTAHLFCWLQTDPPTSI
ncbi:MAG: hypothetical protein J0H74_36010 [Chitinophagaceae bacterium]|nr:hypothetical protein [Chitinophagaceae bacterium]